MLGNILSHTKNSISVGPATVRGLDHQGKRIDVPANLRFEQTFYGGSLGESDRIDIKYMPVDPNMHNSQHGHVLGAVFASELQSYGKNVIGFGNIRLLLSAADHAAFAVWLDAVQERAMQSDRGSFFVEVGMPSYGSRDEILGTRWHRKQTEYPTAAAAFKAMRKMPETKWEDADLQVVNGRGEVQWTHAPVVIPFMTKGEYEESLAAEALFGVRGLGGILNGQRRYFLAGELWKGKSRLADRRLVLERHDGSSDSGFFLYFDGKGFVGTVHAKTVAKPNKLVYFKKHGYEVRVLRADLLKALEALA